jgi:hypothetical protein
MENETTLPQSDKKSDSTQRKKFIEAVLTNRVAQYAFMVAMLMFILLCGYILLYAGSLFIEAIMGRWYSADAGDFERNSFWLGYLYGFPSLLGLLGGLSVLFTGPSRWHKFKVLLFIPGVIWSALLVVDLVRRSYPLSHWVLWSLQILAMLLCIFVLAGVILKICIPYLEPDKMPAGEKK